MLSCARGERETEATEGRERNEKEKVPQNDMENLHMKWFLRECG